MSSILPTYFVSMYATKVTMNGLEQNVPTIYCLVCTNNVLPSMYQQYIA